MPEMEDLAKEVRRILSASYPASLKTLHDTIQTVGTYALRKWAEENASQILPLAKTVVESLNLWPYTLDIVTDLANVREFRDSLLSIEPRLLNDVLERATTSEKDYERTSSVCRSLLRQHLPESVPLPSCAQLFFHQSFEKAVCDPSVENLEAVYTLLHGACCTLPGILSQGDIDELRDHLIKMMRSAKNEQMVSLLCLAIIAEINKNHRDDLTWTTDTILDTPQRTTSSASAHSRQEVDKFFSGEKAHRTLHLVSLQVVYAYQSRGANEKGGVLKHITVPRRILEAISPDVRAIWARDNAAIVKKLIEKTLQNSRDPDMQLEALAFLSMLCDAATLPSTVCNLFQTSILNMTLLTMDETTFDYLLRLLVPYFAPRLSQSFWIDLLAHILQCAVMSGCATYGSLKVSKWIIHNLKITALENETVRRGILEAVSSIQLGKIVNEFLPEVSSHRVIFSDDISSQMMRNLHSAVICLILSAVVLTESKGRGLQPHLACRLIQSQQEIMKIQDSAVRPSSFTRDGPHGVHIYPAEVDQGSSKQWREKLSIEMGLNLRSQEQRLIHFVESICQDFESRCENVERPLREEEQKHSDLKRKYSELQERNEDFKLRFSGMEAENETLRGAKSAADEELGEAMLKIAKLSQELDELKRKTTKRDHEHKTNLEEARRMYEDEELDLRATIAYQVNEIDDKTAMIRKLQDEHDALQELSYNETKRLQDSLALRENEIAETKAFTETLKLDINQLRKALAEAEHNVDERAQESLLLAETLAESRQEMKVLRDKHVEFEQAKEMEVSQLRESHEKDACDYETKLSSMQQELEEQALAAAQHLSELKKDFHDERKQLEERLLASQNDLKRSTQDCRQKAQQLEDAMKMKSKLLVAMGIPEPEREPLRIAVGDEETSSAILSEHRKPRRHLTSTYTGQKSTERFNTKEPRPSHSTTTTNRSEHQPGSAKSWKSFKVPTTLQEAGEQGSCASKFPQEGHSPVREPMTDASTPAINRRKGKARRCSANRVALRAEDLSPKRASLQEIQPDSSPLDEFSRALIEAEKENEDRTSSASAISNLDIHEEDFDGTTVDL